MRYFIFFLLSGACLQALPVQNPAAPRMLTDGFFIPHKVGVSGRGGYEGSFVQDAYLKQQDGNQVDKYGQTTNSAILTFNLFDWTDLYAVLGNSQQTGTWRFTNPANDVLRIQMESEFDFLWGVGARTALWEASRVTLSLGGRYEQTNADLSWLTSDGISQAVNGDLLSWKSWQVDLDVSYHIDLLTPYIGAKYSQTKSSLKSTSVSVGPDNTKTANFDNRNAVGMVIGCSLSTGKYFMLNLEARLIDEEAATISADIRF